MNKMVLFALVIFTAGFAQASNIFAEQIAQSVVLEAQARAGLNWKVGDTNNYSIDMGFIKGDLTMKVREEVADGFWLNQDVNLMGQMQKAEALMDKNTGEMKKLIVNGKEQEVKKPNLEVIEMKEDTVTVPAGTFKAIYIKAKNKDDNTVVQQWVNPKEIPVSGMAKSIAPTQMGMDMTIELTSFVRQ